MVSEGVVVDNFVDYEIRVKRSLVSSWEEGGLKGIRVKYVSWVAMNWGSESSDAVGIYEYTLPLYS